MCDCKNDCLEIEVSNECPLCGTPFSPSVDIAKDIAEVLLCRMEAVNTVILAAAEALEKDGVDVVAVLNQVNDLMVCAEEVDNKLIDITDFIKESEETQCENCLCVGCPYLEDCDGTVCYLEEEQQEDE